MFKLLKVFAYSTFATACVMLAGIGMHNHGTIGSAIGVSALISLAVMAMWIPINIALHAIFKLNELSADHREGASKILELEGLTVLGALAIHYAAVLFPGVVSVNSIGGAVGAGLSVVVLTLFLAVFTKQAGRKTGMRPPVAKNAQASDKSPEEIQALVLSLAAVVPTGSTVAIGKNDDGKTCLDVYLRKDAAYYRAMVPKEFQGVPVRVAGVVGAPRKLPAKIKIDSGGPSA